MSCVNYSMEIIEPVRRFQFHVSRRLLFSWIKPTILGCSTSELGLTTDDLICYVLPFRSIADMMVTDKACEDAGLPRPTEPIETLNERRAVFFLGHPEGRFGRKTLRQQSTRMSRLFDHVVPDGKTIKIVPVSVFWGHQPDQEKSLFKLLLSENWTVTSRFKKLLSVVFHPNHILIQFGEPLMLSSITESELDRQKHRRKLLRILRVHFNSQKQAIIGPDLSHRRTLINNVIESEDVRTAITKEVSKTKAPLHKVEAKALKHAREIASHQSYRVIRFFHVLLTWLWNNLYDGIQVNNIDRVKRLAQSHEIVYTPCHRSHIDYLLLSFVLYQNGLTPPHIAAGKNLNLPVIGSLLRRAGAFYMRRSFKGDNLYKAVFDEYLHQMFTKGYSVEYFIEGGRSRTGRTLVPRTGMLSMTLRSFQKDSSRPICLMPVYFGYERVLESTTYLGELSGKNKKTESIFDLFKIFRSFKYSFGEVTVNFGQPLLLAEFLDEELPEWQTQSNTADFSRACVRLANELATRINSAAAINVVGLVATAVLSTPRHTIEETHLISQLEVLRQLARDADEDHSVTSLTAAEILAMAITITGLKRTEHAFGVTISASSDLAILLTYYGNNILHMFALPSLVARFVKSKQSCTQEQVEEYVAKLYPFLKAEFFLRKFDEQQVARIIESFARLGLITVNNGTITTAPTASDYYASLQELGEIIEPTLERFQIVAALLMADEPRTIRELEVVAAAVAEQLSAIYGINSPEFFERSLFATFIGSLKSRQLISTEGSIVRREEGFLDLIELTSSTLDADVQYNILQAVSPRTTALP